MLNPKAEGKTFRGLTGVRPLFFKLSQKNIKKFQNKDIQKSFILLTRMLICSRLFRASLKGNGMGLFNKNKDNDLNLFFGPDSSSHLGIKSGNNTFVDGNVYTQIGENFAIGNDGKTYFQTGNIVFGSDGSTHLKIGDNPTWFV